MRLTTLLRRLRVLVLVTAAAALTPLAPALAVGPGGGELTAYDVWIGDCQVYDITVSYNLDSLMGEPTVSGTYAWSGPDDCSLPYSTTIWLKVSAGEGWGYVRLAPVVPENGGGFGYNTTGSPSWNDLLCGFDGAQRYDCFGADDAKWFWQNGYVSDFEVGW